MCFQEEGVRTFLESIADSHILNCHPIVKYDVTIYIFVTTLFCSSFPLDTFCSLDLSNWISIKQNTSNKENCRGSEEVYSSAKMSLAQFDHVTLKIFSKHLTTQQMAFLKVWGIFGMYLTHNSYCSHRYSLYPLLRILNLVR